MSRTQHRRAHQAKPRTHLILDILVLHAGALEGCNERLALMTRLELFARKSERSSSKFRGPWLLVMTHTPRECQLACALARALLSASPRLFQGVRAVDEEDPVSTARAAIELHRLHFPHVAEGLRPARILVLGGIRDQELFSWLRDCL